MSTSTTGKTGKILLRQYKSLTHITSDYFFLIPFLLTNLFIKTMKKIFFVFAAAALLASCTQNEGVQLLTQDADQAINFEAFARTAVTKGTVVKVSDFKEQGIGVFAFYQPGINGVTGPDFTTTKYPSPDFMYNQQVEFASSDASGDAGTWSYTPIKYWPNNEGDKLSFFAYAPWESGTTWETLGIKTNTVGTSVSKTFAIANEVKDQEDYLFAAPALNQAKPGKPISGYTASGDASTSTVSSVTTSYTSASDIINFNFKHILSKINIFVGVRNDKDATVASGDGMSSDYTAWIDKNTEIEIKSIEFKGLAENYVYTLKNTGTSAIPTWVESKELKGDQDIVVEPYTSGSVNYGLIDENWGSYWHRYMEGAVSGDAAKEDVNTNQYMFIAPDAEIKDNKIVFTYEVRTKATDDKNSFDYTAVITKTWADFNNSTITTSGLEAGKQYNLYFLIGMQGVKLSATITDWVNGTDNYIYVPTPEGN